MSIRQRRGGARNVKPPRASLVGQSPRWGYAPRWLRLLPADGPWEGRAERERQFRQRQRAGQTLGGMLLGGLLESTEVTIIKQKLGNDVAQFLPPPPINPISQPFATLMGRLGMGRLGETFIVRDVMVQRDQLVYVAPKDMDAANRIVIEKRFSVIPTSDDGKNFEFVFCNEHPTSSARTIKEERPTSVADHIPDSTPLAEAFGLFEKREWNLTLRGNQVSGLAYLLGI